MIAGDPEAAGRVMATGVDVVLIVGESGPPVPATGPGRLARLIGDPGDPDAAAAAAEMDRELFGAPSTSAPGPVPS